MRSDSSQTNRTAIFIEFEKNLCIVSVMEKKLLIIQSYRSEANAEEERREYRHVIGTLADIQFISLLDTRLPWSEPEKVVESFDGVIFGGSSDFDFDGGRTAEDPVRTEAQELLNRARPLITHILKNKIPCLGICLGHQMIALTQGGEVENDAAQNKLGTFDVSLTPDGIADSLFGALPHVFLAQYDHKDSVTKIPDSAMLLGKGDCCFASILRYGERCWTMQFHVEFDAKGMYEEYRDFPERFPTDVDLQAIVKPSPDASTIIPRFVGLFK